MNKIKNILNAMLLLALPLAFTACGDDVEYSPADKPVNEQVYFSNTNGATVDLSKGNTSFDVTLTRVKTDGATTVPITAEGAAEYFTFPTSASFASGAETTTVSIGYDPEKLGYDNYQTLTLTIADASITTPYGISSYTFKAGIPAPWKSLGKGTFVEDCMTTFFKVENVSYAVEIQESLENPGIYRLVNAYGAAYPYNEEGDYDAANNYYIEINAQDPEGVYITRSNTGMAWSAYGEVTIWSLANYYMNRGQSLEEVKAAGYCGILKNGVISFPVKSLLISMANYQSGDFYNANTNGAFKVALPGFVIADYSVEVSYLGRYTDTNNKSFAIGNVVLGEDVASAKAALVQGTDLEAAIAGIKDGSIEATEITESGTLKMSCEASGTYSFVVVGYDEAGQAQETATVTFDFFMGGSAFDELQKEVSIDAYVGNWLIPAKTSSQSGNVLGVVSKEDDETLLVKGVVGADGYDDTFVLQYDKETGWLILMPQNVASYNGSACILAPLDMATGGYTTEDYFVGGLTKDGELKFLNSEENVDKWTSFAFLVQTGQGVGLLSPFYDLQWKPYVAQKSSSLLHGFSASTKQDLKMKSSKKILKNYIGASLIK